MVRQPSRGMLGVSLASALILWSATCFAAPVAPSDMALGDVKQKEIKRDGDHSVTVPVEFLFSANCGNVGRRDDPLPSIADRLASGSSELIEIRTDQTPPLFDNLGDITFPISAGSDRVQAYFDQGLRLTYGFNHLEALRAFMQGRRLNPDCAMCYWGEALVLGPNINMPMDPAMIAPAVRAINIAVKLAAAQGDNLGAKEQALIKALATRYSGDADADRSALDVAYADAMMAVHEQFPDDQNIAALYAEALMDLSPWDYWNADGKSLKGRMGDAMRVLESVLKRNPEHAGASHLIIHTVESKMPERAEPYADLLGKQMPGAGHLVHMPSHIYMRVGRYKDSATANRAAVIADEKYILTSANANGATAGNENTAGIYRNGYFPHNIHFLMVSAQFTGDRDTVFEAAGKLSATMDDEITAQFPWVQDIKNAPSYAHAQFSDLPTILAVPDPGDRFAYIKGMWHYMRAVGYAAAGDVKSALAEDAAIGAIQKTNDSELAALEAGGLPSRDVLKVARNVIKGRIAQADGNWDGAISAFRLAVEIQDSLPYTEPAFWYYPVRQSLGAALMQSGDAETAEQIFTASLEDFPNNGWSLYGLMKAQISLGKDEAAAETRQRFENSWSGDSSGQPDLLSLSRL